MIPMCFAALVLLKVARVDQPDIGSAGERDLEDIASGPIAKVTLDGLGDEKMVTTSRAATVR